MSATIAVFGPTAVGKTDLVIALARALGAEVVNADAVQIYRGLDRGAAKPTLAQRQGVVHHLLDVADPDQPLSVAVYQTMARAAAAEVARRGRPAIISGGSGLYLRAALGEWTFSGAPPDAELRRWAQEQTTGALHRELSARDPGRAARIAAADRPRILRALEGGGEPEARPVRRPAVLKIGLYRPRDELHRRIDARARQLWPHVVAETQTLLARGFPAQAPALRSIGYRQALALVGQECAQEEAMRLFARDTRRLAKRQMTWWRRERDAIWLRPDDALEEILQLCRDWLPAVRHAGRGSEGPEG